VGRPSDQFIDLDGLRARYHEWGDGSGDTVVFLHGVLSDIDQYDEFLGLLSETRRVVAVDQRGHGYTDRTDDYRNEAWSADSFALWRELDLGCVDLVGYSMGGYNAMRFAALHPGLVDRLVLIDGGIERSAATEPQFWADTMALMPAEGFADVDEFVGTVTALLPRARPAVIREIGSLLVRGDDGRLHSRGLTDLAVLGAAPTPAWDEQRRRSLEGPVLFIRTEHSELFTRGDVDRAKEEIADLQTAELRDSGHFFMWENPNGAAALVTQFLSAESGC
jgi:pimeloyl-ACP methyl ester carboxylesterase